MKEETSTGLILISAILGLVLSGLLMCWAQTLEHELLSDILTGSAIVIFLVSATIGMACGEGDGVS